jgi:exodeoxyribonuclease VII large subunit
LANARAAQSKFDRIAGRLRPAALIQDLRKRGERIADGSARLSGAARRLVRARWDALAACARMLETLSHKATLARGFALVRRNGVIVRRARELGGGDAVQIGFADGEAPATISGARKREKRDEPGQGSLF